MPAVEQRKPAFSITIRAEFRFLFSFQALAMSHCNRGKTWASYGNRAAWCAYGTDKCLVFQPSRCWTQACCTCVPQVLPLLPVEQRKPAFSITNRAEFRFLFSFQALALSHCLSRARMPHSVEQPCARKRGRPCSNISKSSTIGSVCTRPSAIAPRPRRGPAWKGSPCVQPHDALISPLHSTGGSPANVWPLSRRP